MALFTLYRVLNEDELYLFFSDIREGRQVQYHCKLLCHSPSTSPLQLVCEISDELNSMGFALEFDRRTVENTEIRLFCVHSIPDRVTGSSADAIRTVCLRHGLAASVAMRADGKLQFAPKAEHAETSEPVLNRQVKISH